MKDPINNLKNNFVRLRFNRTINVIFTNLSIFRTTNRVGPLVSARHCMHCFMFFHLGWLRLLFGRQFNIYAVFEIKYYIFMILSCKFYDFVF